MFRFPRLLRGACVAAAVALVAPSAAAQGPPATAPVSELALPVLDLELETASLDGSVRRVESREDVRVTLAADVLFAFDRAQLSPRAAARIDQVAQEIRRAGPGPITIEGHTDSRGSAAYNRGLSLRRAEAVRSALARALGASAPSLVTSGRGESEPVARNTNPDGSDSPQGRARNRRVEIRIPRA